MAEEGDHDQLLAQGGIYARLYEMQSIHNANGNANGSKRADGAAGGLEEDEEEAEEAARLRRKAAYDHRRDKT